MTEKIWAYSDSGAVVFPTPGPEETLCLLPRFGPNNHHEVNDVTAPFDEARAKLAGGCWLIYMHVNGRDNRYAPESLHPRYLFQPNGTAVVQIDGGRAHSAMKAQDDQPSFVAYLDRTTGEIIFAWETVQDTINAIGETAAIWALVQKGKIQTNGADWVEIPKCDFTYAGDSDAEWAEQERFFYRFLADRGINGQLV